MADVAIHNVQIIDGTGAEPFDGDVAITDGRVSAVGSVPDADVHIDGDGHVLAPGFVDVHTHDDGALVRHPGMEFKLAQGCTSLVIGNCGFSGFPARPGEIEPSGLIGVRPEWSDLSGFADAVHHGRPAVNAVALVGHNTIRRLVMDKERRDPTTAELDEMRSMVELAMEQGACGFSTGLIYEPGRYSKTEEIVELASVAAAHGGLYATHMRNEGDRLLEAVDEAIEIGQAAHASVQISHHKSAGPKNWGKIGDSLAKVDAANAAGADITLDVYPYTAGSGPMAQYFDIDRIDPVLAEVIRIASCPAFREYEGRMAVDLAAEQGIAPGDVIRNILTAPEGDRTICIQFIIDEADIETNLTHPLMMVGSDGIPDLRGRPHPRLFGTFPKILSTYVRDRGVISLPEAVRRMTSLSCDRFGLADRGRVAEGQWADLVIFDPDRVVDTATYDDPKQEPEGIDTVLVNGQIAYANGAHTGVGAGRLTRSRRG